MYRTMLIHTGVDVGMLVIGVSYISRDKSNFWPIPVKSFIDTIRLQMVNYK